jgi:hypothetical protein
VGIKLLLHTPSRGGRAAGGQGLSGWGSSHCSSTPLCESTLGHGFLTCKCGWAWSRRACRECGMHINGALGAAARRQRRHMP